jgi:low affinity Fe/Cu permease
VRWRLHATAEPWIGLKHCFAGICNFQDSIMAKASAPSTVVSAEGRTPDHSVSRIFAGIANATSKAVGRTWVFGLAVASILVWAASGPFFGFSDTWQLVINTGTTIVTFLMVFLIQNAQNRDGAAIQVKLNELIRVSRVHNSFVGVEKLTDEELDDVRALCERRANSELPVGAAPKSNGRTNCVAEIASRPADLR